MELVVEIKNVYGVEQVYPVCNKAKLFASIAGTKTLTHKVMIDIASLGYLVTLKQPTLNFLKETTGQIKKCKCLAVTSKLSKKA